MDLAGSAALLYPWENAGPSRRRETLPASCLCDPSLYPGMAARGLVDVSHESAIEVELRLVIL